MKAKITEKGVYDQAGKPVTVGTVLTVNGDTMPRYLVGKAVPADGAQVVVTNPAAGFDPSGADRQELLKLAAIELEDDGFLDDGRPDVRALNAELTAEAKPFTAAERDALWPGVADAVAAERDAA